MHMRKIRDLACRQVYSATPGVTPGCFCTPQDVALAGHLVGTHVIAIRGSDEREDWEDGLDCRRGLLGQASMEEDARTLTVGIERRLAGSDWPLILCGHSRGGAMAHMVAQMTTYEPPIRVVSFGAPRAFYTAPIREVDSLSIEAAWDPVPEYPTTYRKNPNRVKVGRWWHVVTQLLKGRTVHDPAFYYRKTEGMA